jgi:hypothetical protein
MIAMQHEGGANHSIFNDSALLWTLNKASLSVCQLDGTYIAVIGLGIVVIRPPGSSKLLALWQSYYFPKTPQNTFSPNAIKHCLSLPSVNTEETSFKCQSHGIDHNSVPLFN